MLTPFPSEYGKLLFPKSSQEEQCKESSTQIKRSRNVINTSIYITSTTHYLSLLWSKEFYSAFDDNFLSSDQDTN